MTDQIKPKTLIYRVKCPLTLMNYYFTKKATAEKYAAKGNLFSAKLLNPKAKKKQLVELVNSLSHEHLYLVFEEELNKPGDLKELIKKLELKAQLSGE